MMATEVVTNNSLNPLPPKSEVTCIQLAHSSNLLTYANAVLKERFGLLTQICLVLEPHCPQVMQQSGNFNLLEPRTIASISRVCLSPSLRAGREDAS